MSVSLLEVVSAAQLRAIALTAETSGYLVLALIDAGALDRGLDAQQAVLLESGEVRLSTSRSGGGASPDGELRGLLRTLLSSCAVAHPALAEVARGEGAGSLARELEAALIPVNRAAARRALARTCRETERARRNGKLDDCSAVVLQAAPIAAPARVVEPPAPVAAPSAPVAAHALPVASRPASQPGQGFEPEPVLISEHTVRIDQLRGAAQRLSDVQASELQNKTPFLGSVGTALREPPALIPPELAAPAPVPTHPAPDVNHTPQWQPSVEIKPAPRKRAPVSTQSAVESQMEVSADPAPSTEESAGVFSLLLDETGSSAPPQVNAPSQLPPLASKEMLYAPRKSQLADLLAGFETAPLDSRDVSRELKQMVGLDASASSQTPPPVGFSEVDGTSPTPAPSEADASSKNGALGRAAGVGLATLASLSVIWLALRGAATSQDPQLAAAPAAEARACRATVRVFDAPRTAEIRLRAPAPGVAFAPMAAHGSEALFPGLPCGAALEVMIRDLDAPDGPWSVIPVAAEELDEQTELFPLQVSAARP